MIGQLQILTRAQHEYDGVRYPELVLPENHLNMTKLIERDYIHHLKQDPNSTHIYIGAYKYGVERVRVQKGLCL